MNLKRLKMMLKYLDPKMSVLLKAVHGIGKTAWVKHWAKEHGMKCVIWHASHAVDAGDLTGLPFTEEQTVIEPDGREYKIKITKNAPPEWMVHGKPIVLLLDEINRGINLALNALMQITNDQSFDGIMLPEGSRIFACVNPEGGDNEYEVNHLDPAQLDRFAIVEFFPTPKEWLEWAETEGEIDYRVIDYIKKFPENLDPGENPEMEKLIDFNACEKGVSRRNWEHLSITLKRGEVDHVWDDVDGMTAVMDAACSILGNPVGMHFAQNMTKKKKNVFDVEEMLNAKSFKKSWKTALMKMSNEETPDAIMFLEGVCAWMKNHEADMAASLKGDKQLVCTWAENFYQMVSNVNVEVQVHIVNDAVLKAFDNGDKWISYIQSGRDIDAERFAELYAKAAIDEM